MKTKNYILALGALTALFFAACKKTDSGPSLTAKEKTLTSKVWKLESLTVPKSDDATKDSSIMKTCSESALAAFDAYKAFQIADSKNCDSTIVPYDKGTWKFFANEDSLSLEGKKKLALKIITLNETTLKAVFRDSVAPDKISVKTITFK